MRKLVYSTEGRKNVLLCELNDMTPNLHIPIMSSERFGQSFEAMTVCESVNQMNRECIVVGQYKANTNKQRTKPKRYKLHWNSR